MAAERFIFGVFCAMIRIFSFDSVPVVHMSTKSIPVRFFRVGLIGHETDTLYQGTGKNVL